MMSASILVELFNSCPERIHPIELDAFRTCCTTLERALARKLLMKTNDEKYGLFENSEIMYSFAEVLPNIHSAVSTYFKLTMDFKLLSESVKFLNLPNSKYQ